METSSQKSASPASDELAQSKVDSDEVKLDDLKSDVQSINGSESNIQPQPFNMNDIKTVQSESMSTSKQTDSSVQVASELIKNIPDSVSNSIETSSLEKIQQPQPQMTMEEMMARMQEMEGLLVDKDAENRQLKENAENLVSKDEVQEIIGEHSKIEEKLLADNNAKDDIIRDQDIDNLAKDKIIVDKDNQNELLSLKFDNANNQIDMQKQMLDIKNGQIDKLDIDKSELKVEVKELKNKLDKWNHNVENKSDIKGLSDFDVMSDLSDLGKAKSDKSSVGKSSNSSILKKENSELKATITGLKEMLSEQTDNDFYSNLPQYQKDNLVPLTGQNSDTEQDLNNLNIDDIDLT